MLPALSVLDISIAKYQYLVGKAKAIQANFVTYVYRYDTYAVPVMSFRPEISFQGSTLGDFVKPGKDDIYLFIIRATLGELLEETLELRKLFAVQVNTIEVDICYSSMSSMLYLTLIINL